MNWFPALTGWGITAGAAVTLFMSATPIFKVRPSLCRAVALELKLTSHPPLAPCPPFSWHTFDPTARRAPEGPSCQYDSLSLCSAALLRCMGAHASPSLLLQPACRSRRSCSVRPLPYVPRCSARRPLHRQDSRLGQALLKQSLHRRTTDGDGWGGRAGGVDAG
jgi:hypothetical protein